MALPTPVKTWQIDGNNAVGGGVLEDNCDEIWLQIKNSLKGFASGAWSVWGSCDGSGGGGSFGNNDSVDRWVNVGDIVHNSPGSNHSWIVLEATSGTQICVDCNGAAAPNEAELVVSFTGFSSNGTATIRPTAPDEITLDNGIVMIQGTSYNYKVHVLLSTDGQETRVFVYRNTVCFMAWVIGTAKDIPAALSWDGRFALMQGANGSAVCTYANLNDSGKCKLVIGGDTCSAYLAGESANALLTGELQTVADEDTGEWPILPIGLQVATAGHRGRKGAITDLWWGATSLSDGDAYPSGGTREFAQFGVLVVPWDGSVPEVT